MASSISEAQAELISSLSLDDIPMKLRCAICSKLAVNAFRLPCCEQAICETCQSSLPQSCPVCEHSPLAADDCNPNKSLRTTIRVFLRTAEKKREASRPKESKDTTPATPVEAPKPVSQLTAEETPARQEPDGTAHAERAAPHHAEQSAQDVAQDADQVRDTQPDESHPSGLTSKKGDVPRGAEGPQQGEHGGPSENAAEEGTELQHADEAQNPEQALAEKTEGTLDNGNDQNTEEANAMNGGYANMMFTGGGGDFNQMQMMMAMQNGMGNNSFGSFPMMGTTPPSSAAQYHAAANAYSGMGMDPMTMQNMYMIGGFQGMGMNGMGGYGGGFGQGSNNNWNGSQSWSFDQNNYNQSGPGMGTGDFGNFNTGFQTGYNQGNQGQYNDYRRNNFGRGRGRGRGFYGQYSRGGYQHQHGGMANNQDQGYRHQHGPGNYAQSQIDSGAGGDSGDGKQVDEHGRSIPGQSGDGEGQGQGQESEESGSADAAHKDSSELASRETLGNEAAGDVSRAMGDASHEPGAIRSVLSSTPDVPINAPTGPKAMRQGLPNTSLHHLRARGYQVGGAAASMASSSGAQQQASHDESSRPRSRTLDRENDQATGSVRDHSRERTTDYGGRDAGNPDTQDQSGDHSRSGSRKGEGSQTQSRSRSRGHGSSHWHRRQRSQSVGDDDYDDGHRRKKHRSSRKHYDDDEEQSRSKEDRHAEKSRSASPEGSRKSGHRSHRDRDKDRDHEGRRDRDNYRDGDRNKSGHRSHRDHDYEHSRRRDKDRGRDKERKERRGRKERHRDKDRERDYRHGSSSRRPSVEGRSTPADKGFDPPSGPRASRDRERHGSHGSNSKGSTPKDPHTLEREARNRERLLKEAQRMALANMAGSKRGREEDDDGGRKGRRTSRRSDARDGDEEERMRRLEAEREAGRWG
ncbi:Uncharacterized protein TPAR_00439 [Tolypocladium paradoxum]|uniref:RING-type domain-containing protein n=1 Tax=Tolypocladium paradoxum TaxID=94208 RepID=A0A2S4LA85_9HYPO|nr:Uncharacterized protein TPAR_00439 [Tolypocladium paradoxum]